MEFVVRLGTEEDMPAMLRLWRKMMDFHARVEPRFRPAPSPVGEQAWAKHLRGDIWGNSDWCVFVAEVDGKLVGQIMGVLRDVYPVFEPERYGYVTDIVVDPVARRGGVGQALCKALRAWFRAQGASHLELQVAHENPVAQSFWRAMGFADYMDTLRQELEVE
jgi:ribosomal protein S18 acetylase RimI-like enzyme